MHEGTARDLPPMAAWRLMLTRSQQLLLSILTAAGILAYGQPASADLKTCGGIFVSVDETCEYQPKQECMTQCMTVAVEESCVTEIYNQCQSSCTTTASTECESSCTTSCVQSCTTNTTATNAPSCMDLCLTDCQSDSACAGAGHAGRCGRCAKFNCEKKCEARCGDAPEPARVKTTTECMPTCTNACAASCTAKVNTQCQLDCQERMYTQCEQKMVQQCETHCRDKGGAIFCDGQFVNASSARDCAGELKAKVDIDIDIDAALEEAGQSIESAANSVSTEVDKHVDSDCAVADPGARTRSGGWLGALTLLGFAAWRVRRRH